MGKSVTRRRTRFTAKAKRCTKEPLCKTGEGAAYPFSLGPFRIVRRDRYVVFQLTEVAVPRSLFADILCCIDRLRGAPAPAM